MSLPDVFNSLSEHDHSNVLMKMRTLLSLCIFCCVPGTIAEGPRSQVLHYDQECGIKGLEGEGNCTAKAVLSTLHSVPWVTADGATNVTKSGECSVGEIICETFLPGGQPQPQCPRYICRTQIDRLEKELGCQLLSGWEEEFFIVEKNTTPQGDHSQHPDIKPIFDGRDDGSMLLLSEQESLLYRLESQMHKASIDVESITIESSSGLYEFCLSPAHGISAVDGAWRFKQAAKEISSKWKGHTSSVQAVFMTKPFMTGEAAGLHYNFSLWDEKDNNVFYSNSSVDHLSEIARYWLAGLIKHSTALVALSSPTVNCYRRLHGPWAPDLSNWGVDDRSATFRVKNEGIKGTYFENRLPSAACNPYLVVASTIAAGLDGVINKLPLDREMNAEASKLPDTLNEALQALENDTCLTEQLGEDFIKAFIKVKREVEINELDQWKHSHEDIKMQREREQYLKFI